MKHTHTSSSKKSATVKSPYAFKDNDLILDGSMPSGAFATKRYILKIKDMPDEERPREKMLKHGPAHLSVTELLAIVLSTGTKTEGVMEMASRILKDYGAHSLMSRSDARELSTNLNIPLVKAMQVVACAEIGRRFFDKKTGELPLIRTAEDVWKYASDMHSLPKEHLRGIYINTHHRVIHDEVISIGTINSNLIHPREVFKPAIQYGAVAVILVHNHPSGVVTPSVADIAVTKQLVEVGKMVGINLVDHVIVTSQGYASVEINYEQ
jgi:DNA repair protein RadC